MSTHTRSALLHSILQHLETVNVSLTELLCFILVDRQGNNHSRLIYADLVRNTKTILSTLYFHTGTAASTREWAHNAMCAHYASAVSDLAEVDETWQFTASKARPGQIREFRIEDMASEMERRAPILWSLLGCLLSGTPVGSGCMDIDDGGGPSSNSDSDGQSDSETDSGVDSDEEYWNEFDEECSGRTSKSRQKSRGVPQGVINRIKTVVILSILMQNCNQKTNALQSIVGIFLHACNTPEKVIKVLARMGISISLASIHRAIHSLSRESDDEIETLGQSLLGAFGYDNFELQLPTGIPTVDKPAEGLLHLTSGVLIRLEHGVTLDDLRCSKLLWERSSLNLRAPDPRVFDPYKTMEFLYTLHPEIANGGAGALSRRGRFRAWFLRKTLFEHGPTSLKALRGSLREPDATKHVQPGGVERCGGRRSGLLGIRDARAR
ncbi:hypothetical protein NUW54_g11088 [Trametes sanguinea]|uniref:Uncharacterized protein n=1 Tax=Trametes sanguinea TaxID=158606 RepID=A0ACC1NKH5_9APHY|nr:hypothetical protein NUW54_g11088 [Trametes sanguinea]